MTQLIAKGCDRVAEGRQSSQRTAFTREAEDLLRNAMRVADDPFLAICQSYQHKPTDAQWSPSTMEDDEER